LVAKTDVIITITIKEKIMADITALFTALNDRFDSGAAQGIDATFQFNLTDADNHYVSIVDGQCEVGHGDHDDPSVTLTMDSDTLQDVMNGEADGMQAFMMGQIKADGDIMLATRLTALFPIG
jgi:putative sterol carrier protein